MNQQNPESFEELISRRISEEIAIGAANTDKRVNEAVQILLAKAFICLLKSNKRIKAEVNPDYNVGDYAITYKPKSFQKNWEPYTWYRVEDYFVNEAGQHLINENKEQILSDYCFKSKLSENAMTIRDNWWTINQQIESETLKIYQKWLKKR
jgi:hypothetical protein